jgi:hypothetical protein
MSTIFIKIVFAQFLLDRQLRFLIYSTHPKRELLSFLKSSLFVREGERIFRYLGDL